MLDVAVPSWFYSYTHLV